MIKTYEEYLQTVKSISFEKMQEIHSMMIEEIVGDPDGMELYDELMDTATRYAKIRAEWLLLEREEKMKRDSGRTACHDSVIVKFNILARYLKMQGKESLWRDELGYEEDDRINRKTIGDFACYLVFVNSINAR